MELKEKKESGGKGLGFGVLDLEGSGVSELRTLRCYLGFCPFWTPIKNGNAVGFSNGRAPHQFMDDCHLFTGGGAHRADPAAAVRHDSEIINLLEMPREGEEGEQQPGIHGLPLVVPLPRGKFVEPDEVASNVRVVSLHIRLRVVHQDVVMLPKQRRATDPVLGNAPSAIHPPCRIGFRV